MKRLFIAARFYPEITPILGGATTVAFVHDNQVEEVGRELLVDVPRFLRAGDCLVQGQVNLVGFVDLPLGDLGHGRAKRLEIVHSRLIYQDVPIRQEQNSLFWRQTSTAAR